MVNEYNADSMSNQPCQSSKVSVSHNIPASVARRWYGKIHSYSMHAHIKWGSKNPLSLLMSRPAGKQAE